ncbi:MAG: hypothetical protein HY565_05820 [Candidatus Kerfeldbacteria bacterium]|nr:hypothetical protein [Candidatus Kerfeldbacteria bacterium]
MKTRVTASTAFVNTALTVVAVLLVAIAVCTYYLALQGDTTALGDPYYEDQILAPERAFAPWTLLMSTIGVLVIAKLVQLIGKRRPAKTS